MSAPVRRHTTGDPALDWLLDRRGDSANSGDGDDGRFRVLNNSRGASRPLSIYGRDGLVIAKATPTMEPKWLCLEAVAPGKKFLALIAGEAHVMAADPSATFTIGAMAYLSASVAGTVTGTPPASGPVWRVGTFLATRATRNGAVAVDLAIDSEPVEEVSFQ